MDVKSVMQRTPVSIWLCVNLLFPQTVYVSKQSNTSLINNSIVHTLQSMAQIFNTPHTKAKRQSQEQQVPGGFFSSNSIKCHGKVDNVITPRSRVFYFVLKVPTTYFAASLLLDGRQTPFCFLKEVLMMLIARDFFLPSNFLFYNPY